MPLDATIGWVFTLYCPGGCHGHQFWHRKSPSEASIQKARNGPCTQLIEAASCVERPTPRWKRKNSANFLAIKRWQRKKIVEVTNHQRSLSKSWRSWPPIAAKLLKWDTGSWGDTSYHVHSIPHSHSLKNTVHRVFIQRSGGGWYWQQQVNLRMNENSTPSGGSIIGN